MNYLKKLCIFALFALALGGCAAAEPVRMPCYGKTLTQLLDATDLKQLFQQAAFELCLDNNGDYPRKIVNSPLAAAQGLCGADNVRRQTVLVTDFVDINTYLPGVPGMLMGELMRGSLNQVCCYKIVQAEFGRFFKLNENGLVSLTRNTDEIKKGEFQQAEAVVGSYKYLDNNKVVLFIRRININTGQVVKMVTREIDYSCVGRQIRHSVR